MSSSTTLITAPTSSRVDSSDKISLRIITSFLILYVLTCKQTATRLASSDGWFPGSKRRGWRRLRLKPGKTPTTSTSLGGNKLQWVVRHAVLHLALRWITTLWLSVVCPIYSECFIWIVGATSHGANLKCCYWFGCGCLAAIYVR